MSEVTPQAVIEWAESKPEAAIVWDNRCVIENFIYETTGENVDVGFTAILGSDVYNEVMGLLPNLIEKWCFVNKLTAGKVVNDIKERM